jgi:hypothetical protein
MVLSASLPDASTDPSGLNAIEVTRPQWPVATTNSGFCAHAAAGRRNAKQTAINIEVFEIM